MNGLDKEKLCQVSMDGANVNTRFPLNLNWERRDQGLSQLVSIETHEIRTLHNAYKNGGKCQWLEIENVTFLHVYNIS